jgi:hypothetical protein
MATILTFDPGKPAVQIPALKISINHVHHIRPPEPVDPLIAIFPNHFQLFKMTFHTTIIVACLWVSWMIDVQAAF